TEGLMLYEGQRRLVDVGALDVPTWREAGLIQRQRSRGIRDDLVAVADDEMPGCLADIDAMVAVGSMAHNPLVFFVEGVHCGPRKRDPRMQLARPCGKVDMLPCSSWCAAVTRTYGVPGSRSKIFMPGRLVGRLKRVWRDVCLRKVRDRIAAGFE